MQLARALFCVFCLSIALQGEDKHEGNLGGLKIVFSSPPDLSRNSGVAAFNDAEGTCV